MVRATTMNLDDIFSKAIERSKLLRVEAAKTNNDGHTVRDRRMQFDTRFDHTPCSSSAAIATCHSNIRGRPPLAPRRPFATHGQARQPTWKRAKQNALRNDVRRINGLDAAINEARRDIADSRAAVARAPENLAITIHSHAVDCDADAVVCSRWLAKVEVLALPDAWGSETTGTPKQPLQSRYTPRRIASAIRSSNPQMPSLGAREPAVDAQPLFSRWQRSSKHETKEAAIMATIEELEVLGKILAKRGPTLKRRGTLDVRVVHGKSRCVLRCVKRTSRG